MFSRERLYSCPRSHNVSMAELDLVVQYSSLNDSLVPWESGGVRWHQQSVCAWWKLIPCSRRIMRQTIDKWKSLGERAMDFLRHLSLFWIKVGSHAGRWVLKWMVMRIYTLANTYWVTHVSGSFLKAFSREALQSHNHTMPFGSNKKVEDQRD